MPSYLAAEPAGPGFAGLKSIYQYTNDDGQNADTVCGLAACATLLTHCGAARPGIETLREIERNYPADLLGGRLGTTPWHIRKVLHFHGASELRQVRDLEQLKQRVRRLMPVICLIQNSPGLRGLLSGGAHWFLVFAYDEDGVFVTNYGDPCHLTWADFREKWESPLSRFAGLFFRGVTSASRVLSEPVVRGTRAAQFA
jgi:hypothetical protein